MSFDDHDMRFDPRDPPEPEDHQPPDVWLDLPTHAGEWLVLDDRGTLWDATVRGVAPTLGVLVHGAHWEYEDPSWLAMHGWDKWRFKTVLAR